MKFEFNGVTVSVTPDSDPELIYRDCDRATSGYIASEVGPNPKPRLSKEDLLGDKRIRDRNERKRRKEYARWAAKARAHRERVEAIIAGAPEMELSDEQAWQQAVNANTDSYSRGVIDFAERWARLMQLEVLAGKELEDIADSTSHEADIDGITGFMYGCAVHILAGCWKHGGQLRKWHNRRYGVSEDTEGTVNPAILTVSPA